MTYQDPNNPQDNTADNAASKNRTITILAAALAVIAVVAVALLAWSYFGDDANNDDGAAATSSTTTVTAEDDPAQTFTETNVVLPPEQDTATVTNTVEQTVEETLTPTEPTTGDPNAPGAPTELPADVCEATKFQDAGHDFVDTVMFCEEGWARGGQAQTDYVRNFQWNNGRWDVYPAAGESVTTGYLCYDTETMARAGAPRVMLMEVLDCEYSN